ncbi:hypothetical protein PMAYCL1PPCAC_00023, partial [Pristionchus mayeri]
FLLNSSFPILPSSLELEVLGGAKFRLGQLESPSEEGNARADVELVLTESRLDSSEKVSAHTPLPELAALGDVHCAFVDVVCHNKLHAAECRRGTFLLADKCDFLRSEEIVD